MSESLEEAVQRGRDDVEYWVETFLGQKLHAGQLEWMENAEATINVLPTANRWGKSHLIGIRHLYRAFYKMGSEWRWLGPDGAADPQAFVKTKYKSLHCAQGWDTTALVWEEMLTLIALPGLAPFIKAAPRSMPPYIQLTNGAKILFRTLGPQGQGIDGTSLLYVSIDEAGWISNLKTIMDNVVLIRIADVQGMVDLAGTMKAGISRDFFQYAKRASVYTGRNITFDFAAWLKERAAQDGV